MKRKLIFIYGLICYLIGATAYLIGLSGFLANLFGIYSIDIGREEPFMQALLINVGLIVLFGLPHSLMARQRFKKWWTRLIPAAAERSTFMLQAGLLASLLIWQWRAMPTVIWQVEQPLLRMLIWSVYWLGWLIALGVALLRQTRSIADEHAGQYPQRGLGP